MTQKQQTSQGKQLVRTLLKRYYNQPFRIKVKVDEEYMTKQAFIETLKLLRELDDRTEFLAEEIGMDVTGYDDKYFRIIENLLNIAFSKEQVALIRLYIYELLPDKEYDGKITITKDKKEQEVDFKTPEDVWKVIKSFEA